MIFIVCTAQIFKIVVISLAHPFFLSIINVPLNWKTNQLQIDLFHKQKHKLEICQFTTYQDEGLLPIIPTCNYFFNCFEGKNVPIYTDIKWIYSDIKIRKNVLKLVLFIQIKTENHIVINITRKERIFSAAQKRVDTNHVGSCSMP